MNRRTLLGRLVAVAGGAALAPSVAPVEASEQDRVAALVQDVMAHPGKYPEIEARARELMGEPACADCARLFDGEVVLPSMYAEPAPDIMQMARGATHERALREGVSHDEAALWAYWQGVPSYGVVTPSAPPTFEEG